MLLKPDLKKIAQMAAFDASTLRPPRFDCTPDLANWHPGDLLSRSDGSRIAGSILPSDLTVGAPSPAVWGYFTPLSLWAAATFSMALLAVLFAVIIPFWAWGETWALARAHGASFIGATGSTLWSTLVGVWALQALILIPFTAMKYYWFLFVTEQEAEREISTTLSMAYGVASAGIVLLPIYGPIVAAMIAKSLPVMFRLIMNGVASARQEKLRATSGEQRGSTLSAARDTQLQALRLQGALSLNDKTRLIPFARSKGILRCDGDMQTPDPAPPYVAGEEKRVTETPVPWYLYASITDLAKHVFVVGEIGAGKTQFLKNFIGGWVAQCAGGLAVFDELKAKLQTDVKEYLQANISPRTHKLNLIAGLEPAAAMGVIFKLKADTHAKSAIWDTSGAGWGRDALEIIRYARETTAVEIGYSLSGLRAFWVDEELRKFIFQQLPPPTEEHVQSAIDKWSKRIPVMHAPTRDSVVFTVEDGWLDALCGHKDLRNWTGDESDVNIAEDLCHGAHYGITCTFDEYGEGANMANALIRETIFTRIKRRPDVREERAALGETDVGVVVDECASSISERDQEAASTVRSAGGIMVYCCQNFEQLDNRLGSASKTDALRGSFVGVVAFLSTDETMARVSKSSGSRVRIRMDKQNHETAPLMQMAQASADSGDTRRGHGQLMNVADALTTKLTRLWSKGNVAEEVGSATVAHERQEASIRCTIETMPVITTDELKMHLSVAFAAYVQLPRANTRRREICDLTPAPLRHVVERMAQQQGRPVTYEDLEAHEKQQAA